MDEQLRIAGFTTEMKFYLYKSRAKIDWFYQQIQTPARKKKALEWKINVGAFSAGRRTETEHEVNDEDKLRAVLEELESQEQIGGIDEKKPYIRGILSMRWGLYNDSCMRPETDGPLVYFSGLADGFLVGLGGSSHHVQGMYGITSTASRSATPTLVRFLRAGLTSGTEPLLSVGDPRDERDEAFRAMAIAHSYLTGVEQSMEFVAKTLIRGNATGARHFIGHDQIDAILATPLYVRQIDHAEDD